jgi:methionyl-tRNA synthetase
LRYYLTAIAPETARTAYEPAELIVRNDNELVATLGNFVNRTVTFAQRYFEGKVPAAGARDELDLRQLAVYREQADKIAEHLEACRFKAALLEVMALARAGNLYLDQKKPWNQRKTDMAACGTTINMCLQMVRALAVLIQPFLPFAAQRCLEMLSLAAPWSVVGAERPTPADPRHERALRWDQLGVELPAGHPLGEPTILFRKMHSETAQGA